MGGHGEALCRVETTDRHVTSGVWQLCSNLKSHRRISIGPRNRHENGPLLAARVLDAPGLRQAAEAQRRGGISRAGLQQELYTLNSGHPLFAVRCFPHYSHPPFP